MTDAKRAGVIRRPAFHFPRLCVVPDAYPTVGAML
jgi:hypothetical protein